MGRTRSTPPQVVPHQNATRPVQVGLDRRPADRLSWGSSSRSWAWRSPPSTTWASRSPRRPPRVSRRPAPLIASPRRGLDRQPALAGAAPLPSSAASRLEPRARPRPPRAHRRPCRSSPLPNSLRRLPAMPDVGLEIAGQRKALAAGSEFSARQEEPGWQPRLGICHPNGVTDHGPGHCQDHAEGDWWGSTGPRLPTLDNGGRGDQRLIEKDLRDPCPPAGPV